MRRSRITAYVASLLLAVGGAFTGAAAAQASPTAAATGYVALGDSYSSGSAPTATSAPAATACAARSRTPTSGPPLIHPRRSPSRPVRALVRVMSSQTSSARSTPPPASSRSVSAATTRLRRRHDHLRTQFRQRLSVPDRHRQGVRRLDAPRSTRLRLLRDQRQSTRRTRGGARIPRFYKLGATCLGLSDTKRAAINGAADYLDSAIAKRAADHGFTFGDVRTTFTGHELCSGSAWLHSLNLLNITESYHPTAVSHSGGYLPVFTGVA